jgi:opacity protein-like surface antigen
MNGTYNFFQSRLTPFVTGGLGWTWIDTNIASEPPQAGCWWTWYGYVCTSWQNTKTVDAFSYQLGAGIRYDVSDSFVVQGSYRMTWMNLKDAEGTPNIDGFQLSIGWKF